MRTTIARTATAVALGAGLAFGAFFAGLTPMTVPGECVGVFTGRSQESEGGGGEESELHVREVHAGLHQLVQNDASFATAATAAWIVFWVSSAATHASNTFDSHWFSGRP